jgi:CRP-like cAMP-binding protein
MESMAWTAFLVGVVSAASLPLGAVTAMRFHFPDRVVSFLMAFGGGALLAALSIDLVAHAVEAGHIAALSVGWLIGGVLFVQLNNVVNDFGGFARKVSTTVYQLRRREHQQFRHFVRDLRRLDIFSDLPKRDYEALRAAVRTERIRKGGYLFRKGDPARYLHAVISGTVDLIDPSDPEHRSERLGRRDVIGRMAFLAGAPNTSDARAVEDSEIMRLPRTALFTLLPNSPELIQAVHRWLRSQQLHNYLKTRQGMAEETIERWLSTAGASLHARGTFPDAIPVDHNPARFFEVAPAIHTVGLFADLPDDELQAIAEVLTFKRHGAGHTFYYKGDPADRLYIIDRGAVALVDPGSRRRQPITLQDGDAFGFMAFITGVRHSVNAFASAEVQLWVLLRNDFDDLVERLPYFNKRVEELIGGRETEKYLIEQHGFSSGNAAMWTRRSLADLNKRQSVPRAADLVHDQTEYHGAPLAIWLGMVLDGIPEALVIGAGLAGGSLSVSLIAGLFIANYPEALSSSAGMKEHGFSYRRIFLLWLSLVILTGAVAALGNVYFVDAPADLFAMIEGVAAGAMLTMIAQTMLPEAYFRGGSIIGFATLLGFLAAILLKGLG